VRHELVLATLGQHMVRAALAAVSVGLAEGLDWPEIQHGLTAQGQGVRLVSVRGPNGSTLLDDSYNASPTSTAAALDFLASLPGRHLAVLGDMLELGAGEEDGHRAVGRCAAQGVEVLLTVGQRARLIAAEAIREGLPETHVHVMDDSASASDYLAGILREGDILLVKGSRGMAMEAIVRALEDRSAEAGA
jgi:UDP-N-acetylmuramoyl-tripeptide--D-alanyl-D-alanine ligase